MTGVQTCALPIFFHLHVALKVQLTGVNGLDGGAVDVGNDVAGDAEITGNDSFRLMT